MLKEIWNSMMLFYWGNINVKYKVLIIVYCVDNWDFILLEWCGDYFCYDFVKDFVLLVWKFLDFYLIV